MGKKPSLLANVNTDEVIKSVTRDNAEKQISKIFKVNIQQDQRIREAMYLSGRTLKDITLEGIDLWIEKNLKGKM